MLKSLSGYSLIRRRTDTGDAVRPGFPRRRVQLSGVDYIDRFAVHKCLDIVNSRIHDALAAAFGRP